MLEVSAMGSQETQLTLGDYEADDVISHLAIYKSDEGFSPPLPSKPILHPPGSPEKVEELARRVERGQHLWHEGDAVSEDVVKKRAELMGVDLNDFM